MDDSPPVGAMHALELSFAAEHVNAPHVDGHALPMKSRVSSDAGVE